MEDSNRLIITDYILIKKGRPIFIKRPFSQQKSKTYFYECILFLNNLSRNSILAYLNFQ